MLRKARKPVEVEAPEFVESIERERQAKKAKWIQKIPVAAWLVLVILGLAVVALRGKLFPEVNIWVILAIFGVAVYGMMRLAEVPDLLSAEAAWKITLACISEYVRMAGPTMRVNVIRGSSKLRYDGGKPSKYMQGFMLFHKCVNEFEYFCIELSAYTPWQVISWIQLNSPFDSTKKEHMDVVRDAPPYLAFKKAGEDYMESGKWVSPT